jgi:hypothetical protein
MKMPKVITLSLGAGLLMLCGAYANASCSSYQPKAALSFWQQSQSEARLMPVGFQLLGNHDDDAAIVGLWKFTFTAQGNGSSGPPDGTPIDHGYVQWHEDGTELMNSGRAPTTGDFCMGVWEQVGHATFKLNHFAMAWAFDPNAPVTGPGTGGADFVGPANIRETVTVDRSANHYSGYFTLVQYAADEKTVLATIKGVVKGTRITVDSTIGD